MLYFGFSLVIFKYLFPASPLVPLCVATAQAIYKGDEFTTGGISIKWCLSAQQGNWKAKRKGCYLKFFVQHIFCVLLVNTRRRNNSGQVQLHPGVALGTAY